MAVPGYDMTPEAALTKLAVLLGQDLDTTTVEEMIQRDAAGESSPGDERRGRALVGRPEGALRSLSPRPSMVVRGAGRYEVLLVLLAAVLVLAPFVSTALEPVIVALLGGAFVYALWTSRAAMVSAWIAASLAVAAS